MSEEIINVPSEAVKSIEVYDRIADPMTAIKTLGASIFKSGIFGLDKPEQGEVLAMECLAQRKSPLELARTYHFINGQLAIKADALLAKFHQAGGSVLWIARTHEVVKASFARGESNIIVEHTIKQYIDNKVALGKDGRIKDNWAKYPTRMLTARAISEGVRLIAPECCFGTYVSEELEPMKPAEKTVDLDSLIPPKVRPAAVRVLIKSAFLEEGQGWDDIPPSFAETIAGKRLQPFIDAVHKEHFNSEQNNSQQP